MTRNRLLGLIGVAALGVAVAVVLLSEPDDTTPRLPEPGMHDGFDPYAAAATASRQHRGAPGTEAVAEGTGSGHADEEPAAGATGAPAAAPPGEGTGHGPRVGVAPNRANDPVVVIHTDLPTPDDEEAPTEGTGLGIDDDPDQGLGPGDGPPRLSDEARFFDNIQAAYADVSANISECLSDAPHTRDVLFVEMTVADSADDPLRGDVRIDQLQSAALSDTQRRCVSDVVTDLDVPPAWAAGTGEGPGFTTRSDSDIEYTLVFELEVGDGG